MAIATTNVTNALDTGAASGQLFENVSQAAQFTFNENALLRNLVTVYNMQGTPGLVASVPVYPKAAAVTALTAGHDITQGDDIAPTAVDITAAEFATMAKIQDIVVEASPSAVAQDTGRVLGDAIAQSMDETIVDLFASATSEAGPTADSEMTADHILKAAATLRNNGVPMQGLVGVLSPFQAYNVKKTLANAGGSLGNSELAEQVGREYFIGRLFGIDLYESASIDQAELGSDGNNDAVGAVFHPAGIGMAMKRDLRIALERDESFRGFEVVASAVFGAAILDQNKIVKLTSDSAL